MDSDVRSVYHKIIHLISDIMIECNENIRRMSLLLSSTSYCIWTPDASMSTICGKYFCLLNQARELIENRLHPLVLRELRTQRIYGISDDFLCPLEECPSFTEEFSIALQTILLDTQSIRAQFERDCSFFNKVRLSS